MKILLTGAQGYIGTALAHVLAREHEVLPIDTRIHASHDIRNFGPKLLPAGFKPDVVLNFAGLSGILACSKNPDDAIEVNGDAVVRLALLWPEAKFIQASTATCLSPTPSVYKDSKLLAEEGLEEVAQDREGETIICRFGTVFGRGPGPGLGVGPEFRWDLPLHAMAAAAKKGSMEVRNGDAVRPWLSLSRLLKEVEIMIEAPSSSANAPIVALAEFNLTFRSLAQILHELIPCTVHYLPHDGPPQLGYSLPLLQMPENVNAHTLIKAAIEEIFP